MKFNNAFLTASHKVGIQFTKGQETFTLYRDKYSKIIYSDNVKEHHKVGMRELFLKYELIYLPKAA